MLLTLGNEAHGLAQGARGCQPEGNTNNFHNSYKKEAKQNCIDTEVVRMDFQSTETYECTISMVLLTNLKLIQLFLV